MEKQLVELLMSTHNDHKLQEIRSKLRIHQIPVSITSLKALGDMEEIPEDGDTLEANALQKARTAYQRHGINCFADDTGLEVEALGGRPGVHTARYAGEHCSPADNRYKMLQELSGAKNRKACFRTVIALILEGREYTFSGEIRGEITTKEIGAGGFGYDPIFRPEGYEITFAQMNEEEKNKISHRGKAVDRMIAFLRQYTEH